MRSRIAVAAALVLLLASGCYFRKYEKLARTHVGVIVAMTDKIVDLTVRDGTPPESLAEYRYPLERAEDFARIAGRRFEGRASLRAFRELCETYARLLTAAARARGSGDAADAAPATLRGAAVEVRAAATRVEQALDREHGA